MKLRCINNSGYQMEYLTVGKIYEAEPSDKQRYYVTNDDGDCWEVYKWRFKVVELNKNIKIL